MERDPLEDHILDYAIEYKLSGTYSPSMTKEKKRTVRKRAATTSMERFTYKGRKEVVTEKDGACHSDATSGLMWRIVAERFY